MKTFAARPRAIAVFAALLMAATLPPVVESGVQPLLLAVILCLLAAAIAVHDLATLLIPDRYTIGVAAVALADWWLQAGDARALLWRAVLAALVVLGLWLFDAAYGVLRGRTSLGFGDIKLLGASALLVGIGGVGAQLMIAAIAAFAFVVMRAYRLRRPLRAATKAPFGTFLAPALAIVWAWLPAPW